MSERTIHAGDTELHYVREGIGPVVLLIQGVGVAMSRFNQVDRLRALASIPTLVVSGAHDRIARPSSGRALAAAIPGARYVEFPNAAHALPFNARMRSTPCC